MSRSLRLLWRALPKGGRLAIKDAIYRVAPFLFSKTSGFNVWLAGERRRLEAPTRPSPNAWFVLTTIHSEFIADCICTELRTLDHEAFSGLRLDEGSTYAHYIVVAPHAHERLPDRYIAYQVEQLSTSRYLTDQYKDQLRNAEAVLEYSSTNIPVLADIGVDPKRTYLVQVDKILPLRAGLPKSGAIFIGDTGGSRRPDLLAAFKRTCALEALLGVYGKEADRRLEEARVVVNIHYYPEANLESERVFRSLSFGTPVVSETAPDVAAYRDFGNAVHFVGKGDMDGAAHVTRRLLNDEEFYASALQAIEKLRGEKSNFSEQLRTFVENYMADLRNRS